MNIQRKYIILVLIRGIFVCCATILTGIISLGGVTTKITLLGVLLAFGIYLILEFKYNFMKNCFESFSKKRLVSSISLTVIIIYFNRDSVILRWSKEILEICQKYKIPIINNHNINALIMIGICLGGIATCVLIYWVAKYATLYVEEFIPVLDKIDKIYLVIWTSILGLVIVALYFNTTAFYSPTYVVDNVKKVAPWDVVYSLDTPDILANNYLFSIYYGDLGHSLYSIIMLPIGAIIKVLSNLYNVSNGFVIIVAIFNALTLNISTILIKKMLKTNWALLLISLSHPFLVFSLSSERYQITTFSVVLFVYFCIMKDYSSRVKLLPALGGSTITNIALIPFVEDFKVKRLWIINLLKAMCSFLIILVVSGRIGMIMTSIQQFLGKMSDHAKPVPLMYKLQQYTTFLTSCIFATPYKIINNNYPAFTWEIQGKFNIIGIIILAFIIWAFYVNRKDKFVQICAYWVVFSFALLALAGWGEGEFPLFSIFFGWAVISLIYKGIDKMCDDNYKIKNIILIFIVINMLIVNLQAIIDLIKFAVQYYPILK